MGTPLLYYTVPGKEIRSYMPAVPVLISAASCAYTGKNSRVYLHPPRLPAQITVRAADSGGFAAMMRWGGTYPYSPRQYVIWLTKWQPQWAAVMDLGTLDPETKGSPDPHLMKARQDWTTEMAWHFWHVYRNKPWAWVPTLHGDIIAQYCEHACELAPLIHEMFAFYAETATWDEEDEGRLEAFRVGIGSLCGRSPKMIGAIVEEVSRILGMHIPLHAWGCKLKVLQTGKALPGVVSVDSAAWNQLFGHEHEKRRASGMSVSAYGWLVSQPDYARKLAHAQAMPQQLSLLSHGTTSYGISTGPLLSHFGADD